MSNPVLPVEPSSQSRDVAPLEATVQHLHGNREWDTAQNTTNEETDGNPKNRSDPAKPPETHEEATGNAAKCSDQLKHIKDSEHGDVRSPPNISFDRNHAV